MEDADFDEFLDEYLRGEVAPNPDFFDTEIVWVRGNPEFGALHMKVGHEVEEHEVEEVIFEIPPEVEVKQSRDSRRTYFWGTTRAGRQLFISCEDWRDGGKRFLKPITAFTPENGYDYWLQL